MKKLTSALLIAAFTSSSAMAASGDVIFNGVVASVCTVTIGAPGTLAADGNVDQLSSKNTGGAQGGATVVATSGAFSVSALAPTDFSIKPPEETATSTFTTTYSVSGATTVAETAGATTSAINAGVNTVNVDLTADRASGAYSAGAYTGLVTVLCE